MKVYVARLSCENNFLACSFTFLYSMQILDQFFDISLSLPKPVASSFSTPIESSYAALSSLEDVIAILRRVSYP